MLESTYVVGFPRIGEQRELKKVLESYWAKNCSFDEVQKVASELKKRHWDYQRDAKIDFISSNDFYSLEILDFIDGDEESYVTFKVGIKQRGLDVSFTEKSKFLKIDGKWLYRSGEFLDD